MRTSGEDSAAAAGSHSFKEAFWLSPASHKEIIRSKAANTATSLAMDSVDPGVLDAVICAPIPPVPGAYRVHRILKMSQRLHVRPAVAELVDSDDADAEIKEENSSGFSFQFEQLRNDGYSRVFVVSRSSVLNESLFAFTPQQTSDLAHALETVATACKGAGLRFETAEGRYRSTDFWHGHVEAYSMDLLNTPIDLGAEPSHTTQFAYAIKQGFIKRDAMVTLCDAKDPSAFSRIRVAKGEGDAVYITRESDGFAFHISEKKSLTVPVLVWWSHNRDVQQQWVKVPCSNGTFCIRSAQIESELYLMSERADPFSSHFKLTLTKDKSLAETFSVDGEGYLCIIEGSCVKPLHASSRFELAPSSLSKRYFTTDAKELLEYLSRCDNNKDQYLLWREQYMRRKAPEFAKALLFHMRTNDRYKHAIHPTFPIVAFAFNDEMTETVLNKAEIEGLLYSLQHLLRSLYDTGLLQKKHKARMVGASATINLDSSIYLNNNRGHGAVPGLSTLTTLKPPPPPETIDVLRRARGYILLDPRVMYGVVKEIKGLATANVWKENFLKHGNVPLNT